MFPPTACQVLICVLLLDMHFVTQQYSLLAGAGEGGRVDEAVFLDFIVRQGVATLTLTLTSLSGKALRLGTVTHTSGTSTDHNAAVYTDSMGRLFDVDGNGRVDARELFFGLILMQPKTPHSGAIGTARLRMIFDLYDTDHNGTISESEFRR
jgi:hypothetical protein